MHRQNYWYPSVNQRKTHKDQRNNLNWTKVIINTNYMKCNQWRFMKLLAKIKITKLAWTKTIVLTSFVLLLLWFLGCWQTADRCIMPPPNRKCGSRCSPPNSKSAFTLLQCHLDSPQQLHCLEKQNWTFISTSVTDPSSSGWSYWTAASSLQYKRPDSSLCGQWDGVHNLFLKIETIHLWPHSILDTSFVLTSSILSICFCLVFIFCFMVSDLFQHSHFPSIWFLQWYKDCNLV